MNVPSPTIMPQKEETTQELALGMINHIRIALENEHAVDPVALKEAAEEFNRRIKQ